MKAARQSFTCLQCRLARPRATRLLSIPRATTRLYNDASSGVSSSFNSLDEASQNSLGEASQKEHQDQLQPQLQPALQHQRITQQRPTIAPRPDIDIKHIRQNPELHENNCLERNYKNQCKYPSRIKALFAQWQARQRDGRSLRERGNALRREIVNSATIQHEDEAENGTAAGSQQDGSQANDPASRSLGEGPGRDVRTMTKYELLEEARLLKHTLSAIEEGPVRDVRTMTKDELLEEARLLKQALSVIEDDEARLSTEIADLAIAIPNLTAEDTPRGDEPRVLSYLNEPHPFVSAQSSDRVWRSHVHIGSELRILDFAGAATTSGWGWYYLLDEGAQLEQALIAYTLASVTRIPGWRQVTPPSIVYSHIAAACGFRPRDQNGETQIYTLAQSATDAARHRPELCLTGTAEIPIAGMRAGSVFEATELPSKRVGVSRCYRAEAGGRGAETKGLYRVHEFSKVEMFAWTTPNIESAVDIFDEIVDAQIEILTSLGLHCRVLEMPSADLGASAFRKIDIEAFFPSRAAQDLNAGWGEVTSASICTDYQSRRLATRVRHGLGGKQGYPFTVNGTALAVPRVLAAVLENGWDETEMAVTIPECLRPWMDGKEKIGMKHHQNLKLKRGAARRRRAVPTAVNS